MLEVENLTVMYGSGPAVDKVSFRAGGSAGQVLALLGPSGCGKSTILRAIAGLEVVAGGSITFDGDDLAGVPAYRRNFGLMFQDGQLFPHQSVAANIGYGLRMRRAKKTFITERVEEMLGLVGLEGFGSRQVGGLSGGQAQRVALARALAPSPRLLLLDEPLSALDRQLRDRLVDDMADILRDSAIPTVVVTHDQDEAANLADQVAVMATGRIVQHDDPGRLWRRPRTTEIAHFLGYRNVVDADVRSGVAHSVFGAALVDCPDGEFRLGLSPQSLVVQARGTAVIVESCVATKDGYKLRVRPQGMGVGDHGPFFAVSESRYAAGDEISVALDPRRVALVG